MTKQYSLKIFFILLCTVIFFSLSLIFSPKASAQVCTIEGYSPPVVPDPAFCTGYFPDTIAFPPCNSEPVCSNKAFNKDTCVLGGTVDGTACCTSAAMGFGFCDQRDLGGGVVTQYDFRCCNFPPTPTPTPTGS